MVGMAYHTWLTYYYSDASKPSISVVQDPAKTVDCFAIQEEEDINSDYGLDGFSILNS